MENNNYLYLISLALFLPLAGFLGLMGFSATVKRILCSIIGCTTILISFLAFASLLFIFTAEGIDSIDLTLFRWIPFNGINADFSLHLDPLSILMTLIITGVGFLIHLYSIGYMEYEQDFARYFACMNFFVFAMLLLVLAGNLLLLFVGWEGVGLASYLLIGYWHSRPAAALAATKAFVINRIGDVGFLIALLLTLNTFGTTDIAIVSENAGQFSSNPQLLSTLSLLFFVGAIGKSAQLPLFTWLPDAMEGPTPVSALIHAATMVTAGVYLVVRLHALFILTPEVLSLIGIIGGITSLFAALCAVGQTDLKKVLAYSTISQLGLMFLACGVGAFYSAMFHLTTHAFIKSTLFLSAGNVVHALHGTTEMGKMGGLRKIFTKTHWLFLIGVLALSGIPPLAAFFSKDLILELEYIYGFKTLFYIASAASILTAFYLIRAYSLTFLGPLNANLTAKEVSSIMIIPVLILAFLSLFGGGLGYSFGTIPPLEIFLAGVGITPAEKKLTIESPLTAENLLSVMGGLAGVFTALLIYVRFSEKFKGREMPLLLKKGFFVNELYEKVLVSPLKKLSKFIGELIEPKFFEGSLDLSGTGIQLIAQRLQRLQSGEVRSYIAWMLLGIVFLTFFLIFN